MKLEDKIRKDFGYNFENFEGLDALKRAVIITIRKHKAEKKALRVTQDRSIRIIKQASEFIDKIRRLHKATVLPKFPKGGISSCEHRKLDRIDVINNKREYRGYYYKCANPDCNQEYDGLKPKIINHDKATI